MDYQVSARKYRPGTFDDVIGQEHVVQTLINAIASQRVAHAFLFSGSRGVGKTTVARIVAKALNCEEGMTGTPCNTCSICQDITQGTSVDVIEIDGASNTSVEDVREVRENVKFAPFRGRYRVYIIDEVHMLSNSAFNALLKTLEEPPGHVVFVFATTEIHKIPATILSRCQHYNFRKIARSEIIRRLQQVAGEEGLVLEDQSLIAIAKASEGSMRDALSLLDQAVAFGGKTIQHGDLETLLGAVPQELVQGMVEALLTQDSAKAVRVIGDLQDQGHDLRAFCSDLVEMIRNLMIVMVVPSPHDVKDLLECSDDELQQMSEYRTQVSPDQIQAVFTIFSQAADGLRVSSHPRFLLEMAAVRATRVFQKEDQQQSDEFVSQSPSPARLVGSPSVASSPSKPTAQPMRDELSKTSFSKKPGPSDERSLPSKTLSKPTGKSAATRSALTGDETSETRPSQNKASVSTSEVSAQSKASGPRPKPATEVGSGALSLNWEEIIEAVADSHPRIAPFLERGVFVSFENRMVTLGFPKTELSARSMIEKEDNLRVISEICRERLKEAVRVRVIELQADQNVGPSPAQRRKAQAQDSRAALLQETQAHPFVQEVLQVFGGEVVEVRKGSPQQEGTE